MTCYPPRRPMVTLCVAVGVAGLSCCAPLQKPSVEPISISLSAPREKLAMDLHERGELAEALIQWTILYTIEPQNDYYKTQMASTRRLIDTRSKFLIRSGVVSLCRRAQESARLSFLKVLALDPKNKDALEYLRQLAPSPSTGNGISCVNQNIAPN